MVLLMAEILLITWDEWNPINNGINYPPQLWTGKRRISAINFRTFGITLPSLVARRPGRKSSFPKRLPKRPQLPLRNFGVKLSWENDDFHGRAEAFLDVPDRKLGSMVIGSMGYFTYL